MEDKPPTPYQSARVQREPPPVLRGKQAEPEFRSVPCASLWTSLPNPGLCGNPPNTPALWPSGTPNWLSRRFHFSCDGEWKNGPLMFGALKMLNECTMMPQRSLEKKYADLELVTFVFEGELKDLPLLHARHTSCGTGATVVAQTLDKVAKFLQIGFSPKRFGGTPKDVVVDATKIGLGEFGLLLSIDSVCEVYVGRHLDKRHTFQVAAEKKCYLLMISGSGKVGSQRVSSGDGATATGPMSMELEAEDCHAILIVVSQTKK